MNLLTAYLTRPATQRILRKKPGQEGFSLIELVVVIAVLAVLTAIALPNFLGVSDDAAARAAQQGAITAFKECQVFKARGQTLITNTFVRPSINDFTIASRAATGAAGAGSTTQSTAVIACFDASNNLQEIVASPNASNKFPVYVVTVDGTKVCARGTLGASNTKTYDVGCSATGTWQ